MAGDAGPAPCLRRLRQNLTTAGLDLARALLGERWRIGPALVLEVSAPRIPCATFAAWMGERAWVRRFTRQGRSGAYLRVLAEGEVRAGDAIEVVHRPGHAVTVQLTLRALTTEPALLPSLLGAGDSLSTEERATVDAYLKRRAAADAARDGA